jgi:KaiC/GvpD/RAD55 family RecA-like ATPase
MLEEGGGEIESIILRKKIRRVVIDSITSFTLLFDDELQKRESSLKLFNMISDWNCTSLLTFEEDVTPDSPNLAASSKALQFESDSIVFIYYPLDKSRRKRLLEVLKMRGTDHSKQLHSFEITSTGIKINPRGTEAPKR